MDILIYKGSSQYGAFDYFTYSLKKSFESRNHKVEIFDLNILNGMEKLSEVFTVNKFDLVIGFNGIGCDIKIGNESIYNIIKTYFLGIFVDHPVSLISRLSTPSHYYLASFLDKSHVDFIQNTIPQSQNIKFFMPLSGEQYEDKITSFEEYKSLKSIEVLFTGSNFGKPVKKWHGIDSFPSYLFDEIADELIVDDYISVEEAFDKISKKYKICFSSIARAQVSNILGMVVLYVRQYKRELVLKELFKSGLNITVYGKNWAEAVKDHSNVVNAGEVSLEKTIELTKKAKVVINLNTNFTNGAHDRVFTGMLNHAIVFTDKSNYYDEYYVDKEDYLTYSLNSLKADIKKLEEHLQDEKKLFNMANNAYEITKDKHSWVQRVKCLENMISLVKNINS